MSGQPLATNTVGHLYSPDKRIVFGGIRHVLKPGGRFAAMVFTDRREEFILLHPKKEEAIVGLTA